ncbi:MAG: 4'-phosphopantetheinyl transferase superfamily protein [Oscillospiraceae bacterium]|jgi:4'-phosphopantetheinyl transferase|nr:4'-phosphopantetheinyl transferase superfamily protein [Oscillospiraceae bacterium]
MLYIFDKVDSLGDDFLIRADSLLSNQRREKVLKYKLKYRQNTSIAAYLLLRIALKEQYGINEAVIFGFRGKESTGKPFLIDYSKIYFNLSHCDNAVACAISNTEIGVDIQHISPVSEAVAKKVLTKSEYKNYIKSKKPDEYFTEIWTIKESYVKKTGQGIATNFSEISADDLLDKTIYKTENYVCCITQKQAKIKIIDTPDLI